MSAPTQIRERREVLATARRAQRAADRQRIARQHHDHAELLATARTLEYDDTLGILTFLLKIDGFVKIHDRDGMSHELVLWEQIYRDEMAHALASEAA